MTALTGACPSARRALTVLVVALLLVAVVAVLPRPVHAGRGPITWWVDDNGSDSNDGTNTAVPFKTITHALTVSLPGDTVMVKPGTYNATNGETFPLSLNGASLIGEQGHDYTLIDAGGANTAIDIEGPMNGVELRGVSIMNARGVGSGGAIIVYQGGQPTEPGWPLIADNTFDSNSSPYSGGGISMHGVAAAPLSPRIQDNAFLDNVADSDGGAINVGSYVDPSIDRNRFENNSAQNGGAISLTSSVLNTATLTGNLFRENLATGPGGAGGAIDLYAAADAEVLMSGNSFESNSATVGGVLRIVMDNSSHLMLSSNDASGNAASDGGGFGWIELGTVMSSNNAIRGSSAANRGAAWYVNGGKLLACNDTITGSTVAPSALDAYDDAAVASVELTNCIVWDPDIASDVERSARIAYCCLHDATVATKDNPVVSHTIFSDPMFLNPASHTVDLHAASPCIDQGTNDGAPVVDYYGRVRPIDGDGDLVAVTDIGAFERRTSTWLTFVAPSVSPYGYAKLTGALRTMAGPYLAGRPILIEWSYNNWASVAGSRVATTTAAGTYSAVFAPTKKTYYRARFVGDETRFASTRISRTVLPKVWLTVPAAKSRMTFGKSYLVTGFLKPQHKAGTTPVTILLYRYRNGAYRLQTKHYHAAVTDYGSYSKYSVRIKLPYRGRWRLKAKHPTDSLNYGVTTTYKSVRVL